MTTTLQLTVPGLGEVPVSFTERGQGRPVLLLHGGGGPATVTGWAEQFAAAAPARVITPIHPGWDGTPRPEGLGTIAGLAAVYTTLLEALDLSDVTVVGNSIGGWIAAETALLHSPRLRAVVLVDAVGVEVPGHPVADFFSLTPAELAQLSYFDPQTYGIDPAKLPEEVRARMAANRVPLALYGGDGMTDPTLIARLAGITTPVLVLWGEADRIGDPDFGRAYAAAIPGATFQLLDRAGHLPQLETPESLTAAVRAFALTGSPDFDPHPEPAPARSFRAAS